MKKVLCITLVMIVGFVGLSYAGIEKTEVNKRLADIIGQMKSIALSTSINLGRAKDNAQALVATFSSDFDAADKTDLITLKTKIETAKAALDDVNTFITTTWGGIE